MNDGLAALAARADGGRSLDRCSKRCFGGQGRGGWDSPAIRPAADTCSGAPDGSCAGLGRGRGVLCREIGKDVLEAVVTQHRALQAGRADLDAEQVEQIVGAKVRDLGERLALDLVREEAGAGLADGAAATGEPDLGDDAVADSRRASG
jgi:hypothetical protein